MNKKSTFNNLFLTALLMMTNTVASGDPAKTYRHADEPIGSVREVYDGALYPDIAANTFRNIDRLFPTRVVRRGNNSQPLPTTTRQLQNFIFESGGQSYDLYDYLATGRVSGLLVIKRGSIARGMGYHGQ